MTPNTSKDDNAPPAGDAPESGDGEVQWREAEEAIEAGTPPPSPEPSTEKNENAPDDATGDDGEIKPDTAPAQDQRDGQDEIPAPEADDACPGPDPDDEARLPRVNGDEAPTVHESLTPVVSDAKRPSLPAASPGGRMVWSAEDAGRFLAGAIRTAQQPLEDALARRTARRWWAVLLLVGILVPAGFAAVGWRQYREASERRLAEVVRERDEARAVEKRRTEDALAAHRSAERATAEREAATRRADEARKEREEAAARLDVLNRELRDAERALAAARETSAAAQRERDSLRQTAEDARRWQRERELLRAQIAGMTQEQEALRRQLAATRALLDSEPAPIPEEKTEAPESSAADAPKPEAQAKVADEKAEKTENAEKMEKATPDA